MILLPSRGRPKNLERFNRDSDETGATEPVTILLDDDDAANYQPFIVRHNWQYDIAPRQSNGERFQGWYESHPSEAYYGILPDDVVPHSPHWDAELVGSAGSNKMSWPQDGIAGKTTMPFIGGDLVRAVGWLCPSGMKHFYLDTLWGDIANALNAGVFRGDIVLEHLHYTTGKAPLDMTTRERPGGGEDVYRRIVGQGMDEIVARCRILYS